MKKLIRQLDDPEIDNMKINSRDYFELVYMRHKYFRRTENPAPGRLEQFEEMLVNISNKMYVKNIEVFKTVGFEMEDLQNIARIHTVSFIGMSGVYENPDKMKAFVKLHKNKFGKESEPTKMDIFKHECYNLARFLNQRMQEVARFSKIKNANIRGTRNQKRFYIGTPRNNPDDLELFENPKYYGYERITEKKFNKLLKENNPNDKYAFLTNDNKLVRAVYIRGSVLNSNDVENTHMDPRINHYYKDPEESLIEEEEYAIAIEKMNKRLKRR